MTPQEKAIELVDKFQRLNRTKISDYSRIEFPTAKQCAIITVSEIEDYLNKIMVPNPFKIYWKEVKKEIELL